MLPGAFATAWLDASLPIVHPLLQTLHKRHDHEEGVGVLAQLGLRYGIVLVHRQSIDTEPVAALDLVAGTGRERRVQRYVAHHVQPRVLVVDESLNIVIGIDVVRDVEPSLLINLRKANIIFIFFLYY